MIVLLVRRRPPKRMPQGQLQRIGAQPRSLPAVGSQSFLFAPEKHSDRGRFFSAEGPSASAAAKSLAAACQRLLALEVMRCPVLCREVRSCVT